MIGLLHVEKIKYKHRYQEKYRTRMASGGCVLLASLYIYGTNLAACTVHCEVACINYTTTRVRTVPKMIVCKKVYNDGVFCAPHFS